VIGGGVNMSRKVIAIGTRGDDLVSYFNDNFIEIYNCSNIDKTVIQSTDDISSSSWWTEGKTYEIQSDFDFNGETVTLPANITLIFNGGIFSNGIIIGDGTRYCSIANRKCFETSLTLTGLWDIDYIIPQHYGAVNNLSTSVLENDSSTAIQKCLDSDFPVLLYGNFYVESGLVISTSQTIRCIETKTIIYTDKDIDVVTISVGSIYNSITPYLKGFPIIDTTNIATHTKSAIRIDMSYKVYGGEIDVFINGNEDDLKTEGGGTIGIYIDCENTTEEWGFISRLKINANCTYVKYGLYIPEKAGVGLSTMWMNMVDVNIFVDGYKHALSLAWGDLFEIKGTSQSRYVLTESEKDTFEYSSIIGLTSSRIDWAVSDFNANASGGYYTNSYYLYDNGLENIYCGRCFQFVNLGLLVFENNQRPMSESTYNENPLFFNISNYKQTFSNRTPFISQLDNVLSYMSSRGTVEINDYDGTDYDFDSNLDVSTALSPSNGVTITNDENVFKRRGAPTKIVFADADYISTDFVELSVTFPSAINIYNFGLLLGFNIGRSNRIQIIAKTYGGGTNNVSDIYPKSQNKPTIYRPFTGYLYSMTGFIMRFIGVTKVNAEIYINDIFAKAGGETFSPIIDIGGGQTIYGDLTLSGGSLKQISLPVYTDNTSAKSAGLVAGAPYRTSTGILMVVYD